MEEKKKIYTKWWFWLIIIFIVLCLVVDTDNTSNTINNTSTNAQYESDSKSVTNNFNEVISNYEENETIESKLKKIQTKYDIDTVIVENQLLTIDAHIMGNAQYSIASDVHYEYIRSFAPIAYKDANIQNFIFNVTVIDSNDKDLKYTYSCSLDKEKYQTHDWDNTLDSNIDDIFVNEAELNVK